MLEPVVTDQLKESIRFAVKTAGSELQILRERIVGLRKQIHRIQPRRSAAISLVGTDGGNNRVEFDPYAIDLVRVVDSNDRQYCLEALTPNHTAASLDQRHFDSKGAPLTPLGRMLMALEMESIADISSVIAAPPDKRSPLWVQVYRELTEWAVLLELLREGHFASDTVVLFDGFLRSKKFDRGRFGKFQRLLDKAISDQYVKTRRRIYLIGIAKKNKFLQKYRLAMALEGVMRNSYPCYVPVDDELQETAYRWNEIVTGGGEGESFTAGQMFLVKFGSHVHDPVWAVDILKSQAAQASTVFGYLLHDAQEGFPVPLYPMCLQQAHEKAALIGLDQDILQHEIMSVVQETLTDKENWVLRELALQATDPSAARY